MPPVEDAGGPAMPSGSVEFSVPSQTFQGALEVGLDTMTPGAEIRYTRDRTQPLLSSTLYDGAPIAIDETTELRAQAFVNGASVGEVSMAHYIARDFDTSSDIALMILDGYGLGEPRDKETWYECAVMTFAPEGGEARLSNLPNLAVRAGYHYRGSSSLTFPQKSYRVEFRDTADQDFDQPLLGMPAEADWALVAPYRDRALIRNRFVFELGAEMGLRAPRLEHAEVYVNYDDRPLLPEDYVGVYNVTELIKNAKNRLDLEQLTQTDTTLPEVSGGYIFKFDWAVSEPPTIECSGSGLTNSRAGGNCWSDLEVVDPDVLPEAQRAYLTDYVQTLHDRIHGAPVGDYASLVDMASFVDNFIINELVKNLDEFTRSAYYHKDRDGVLFAGPLWDYNYSLDCGRSTNRDPEGWQYVQASSEPGHVREGANDWYPTLMADPAFVALVSSRYAELRQTLLSEASLDARIVALAAPLAQAAVRDLDRWPAREALAGDLGPQVEDFQGQVQAIRDWIPARLAWLDAQLL